jgi:hypothetical protein
VEDNRLLIENQKKKIGVPDLVYHPDMNVKSQKT